MRVAAIIAYNGKEFFGSQKQKETPKTVFGLFEHVLDKLGITSSIVASGRTDRGVHASGQVIHFDIPSFWSDTQRLQHTLNKMLPSSIYVKKVFRVKACFHARYSAQSRVYRYLIKVGESNPFAADFITFLPSCDFHTIAKNITLFEGTHDFAHFIKTGSDEKSTQRTIYKAMAYQHKGIIVLTFEADGYLRSQIRFMVASLLSLTQQQIQEKLERKRQHQIKPAPPNGLYLAKIKYKGECYV